MSPALLLALATLRRDEQALTDRLEASTDRTERDRLSGIRATVRASLDDLTGRRR